MMIVAIVLAVLATTLVVGYICFRNGVCPRVEKIWVSNVRDTSLVFNASLNRGIEGEYRFEYGEEGGDFDSSTSIWNMLETKEPFLKLNIQFPYVVNTEPGKTYKYRFVYDNKKCSIVTKTKTFVAGGDLTQE